MFANLKQKIQKSTIGYQPLEPEELYSSPEQFLESITQKINVFEAVYKCLDLFVLPVTSIEDEYVIIVFEIMSEKLRNFYGGQYLIQQWSKKQKIFQAVHSDQPIHFFLTQQRFIYSLKGTSEEAKYLYVSNFYQSVFQKINHPLFTEDNVDGVHDRAVYVDPKQVIVTDGHKIMWAQLKIESILTSSPAKGRLGKMKSEYDADVIEEETPELQLLTQDLEYANVLENCNYDDDIEDIRQIFAISNEGFLRKEVHIAIENEISIRVMKLNPVRVGQGPQCFDLIEQYQFTKQFADISIADKIQSVSIENYADQENLLVIVKSTGECKMMSRDIQQMMIDYQNSIRAAVDEEDSSEDEEELRRLAELEERKKKLCYRLTKCCKKEEDDFQVKRKAKLPANNQALDAVKNFVFREIKQNYFKVNRYFVRRQQIYFENNLGEIKRTNIAQIKNTDATIIGKKLNYSYETSLIQDVTLHLNTFNDFLIANTTLIISHSKVLSIYDFLTKQWTHILPHEQGNLDQSSQTYFGMPDDEIDSLLLNFIFSNSIYDCIIIYRGKFIHRLKYYNQLDKTYFEKGKVFVNQNVLQVQRNVDVRNYRQYGDSTIRTLFMIEDTRMQNQQIWVSENGSRITKLVDLIPISFQWQLVQIPNARSDMLIIYSKLEKSITIYNIPNAKQCLYPAQLQKYQIQKLENQEYDPSSRIQYFIFNDKLYFQKDGNLSVLNLKMKQNALQIINFNKTIKDLYMTHEEAVYYKDKNNIFRFVSLEIQRELNLETQPTEVFNCRGAFCSKLEYSITTNRIALFTSAFEISIVPLLDRYRIDLMASQDFDNNFICWKEIDNMLIALKKPNILVTWNTDTGKIINYHQLDDQNYGKFMRHTEWNGQSLLKLQKEVEIKQEVKKVEKQKSPDESMDSYNFDDENESEKAFEEKIQLQVAVDKDLHTYQLIEIKSPYEVIEHCTIQHQYKPGTNLYISMPYLLVMDEQCTKMYLLEGKYHLKTFRLMHQFYEQQMKLCRPLYFSPNFHHRMFIDPSTKEVVLNFTLTNVNIQSLPIRKQLLFQIEKTHPMIYFHDNDHIMYLTIHGVEKLFTFKSVVGTKRRNHTCELVEVGNIYYNEKSFIRRFILDPLNFNLNQASQMESAEILKFRGDVLKRNLHLNVYKTSSSDQKRFDISRFLQDKNISLFSHFIINNYRQQLTFSYLNWKILNMLAEKKIHLKDLSQKYVVELAFTVLPYNKNIYHILGADYEVLDQFIDYIVTKTIKAGDPNLDNEEIEMTEDIELTEIMFIPDLNSKTPLHESVATNNTRVTDRFVQALMLTDFDHHSRFILNIYPVLIGQVPQRMSTYLDSRLKIPQWISEYTRGRIETGEDCDFVMTADKMWFENLDSSLQGKLYRPEVLEVPLTMELLDLPHLHKYVNDTADEFLEALADTDCIEIFSNKSIQALIEIKWPLVKAGIKKFLFYPYLVFLVSFLYYTIYIFEAFHEKSAKEETEEETASGNGSSPADNTTAPAVTLLYDVGINLIDIDQFKDPNFWLSKEKMIVKIIVQCFTFYFFALEVRQMFIQGFGKYLSNPWNYLDVIPLILISFSIQFENLGLEAEFERPLNAVACFFMWIKFLYFWRIFRQTSKFISMIVAIIGDLRVFMIVFIVTLTAFGNALYIISNNNPICDKVCEEIPEDDREPGRFIHSLVDSVIFSYKMSLGDFDTTDLGSVYTLLALIAFILATLFLTIMMLNILVAVISDSYARVEGTSIEEMYKNFADLISENEYLVYKKKLSDHDMMGDYLYIAKVDKNDDGDSEAWESKLHGVKEVLIKKTENIEKVIIAAQKTLIDQVHTNQETFNQILKENNSKNDQRLQTCVRKLDSSVMKKLGRKDSQSSISGFKNAEEEKKTGGDLNLGKTGSRFAKGVSQGLQNLQSQVKRNTVVNKSLGSLMNNEENQ